MIKLQIGKLKPISDTLGILIQDASLPIKLKYWLYRFTSKFKSEVDVYNQAYEGLVMQYCDRDADGKPIYTNADGSISETNTGRVSIKERQGEIAEAINELNKQTIDIEFDKMQIKIDALPESITAQMMLILEDIMEFSDDVQPPLRLS